MNTTTPTTTKKVNMPLIIAVVAGGWLLVQVLTAPAQPKGADLRLQRQQNAQDVAAIQVADEKARQMATIAEARYMQGALPIFSDKDNTQGVQIAEGVSILDNATQQPLVKGTVVADTSGNTAIIGEGGKPINMAFTGNTKIVRAWLQQFKITPAQTVQQQESVK